MKNAIKRLGAAFLALVLMLSCLLGYFGLDTLASDVVFQDSFNSSISNQWAKKVGSVSGDKYVLNAGESNYVKDFSAKETHMISADVTVKNDKAGKTGGFVSIVSCAAEDMSTGYAFGLGVTKTGSAYLRLYRLGTDGVAEVIKQSSSDIPGVGGVAKNKSYNLKMAISGNRILCFINDNLFVDTTDSLYNSGYVGVNAINVNGTFDNFTVHKLPEQKVEKLTIVEHSEKVSLVEKVKFKINVTYNSIYGTETIDQDTEGVNMSGYDATVGEKTITVSYRGKKVSFPMTVVKDYQAETLWSDNFSSDISEEYEGGTYKDETYNFSYDFKSKNGTAYAEFPNLNGGNVATTVTLTVPDEKTSDWEYYSVSADAIIYSDSTSATKRYGGAGLIFAKTAASINSAFSLRVWTDGTATLQQGTTRLKTFSLSSLGMSYNKGNKVSLRADVYEEYAELYINSTMIYRYMFTQSNVKPTAGIMAVNGTVALDNLKAVSLINRGKHAITKITVVQSDGQKVSHLKSKTLFSSNLLIKADYVDGSSDLRVVKEDMVSGYDSSTSNQNAQTITVKYGKLKTTFKYTYVPYLFYDDFSEKYIRSEWTDISNDTTTSAIHNGRLKYTYTLDPNKKDVRLISYISNGIDWTNYSVSVDVFFENNTQTTSRTAGLVTRYNGASARYELRLVYNSNTITARLMKNNDIIKEYKENFIYDCLEEGKGLGTGITYNLKMSVRGNVIRCYIDGVLLDIYYDDGETYYETGAPGIYTMTNTVSYDNFIVEEENELEVTDLRVSGLNNNTFELYEGADIELWEYDVEIVYADGSFDTVALTDEMLSDFDNTALGKQRIKLTVNGFTDDAYVYISERPEYIEEFASSVKGFESKVTESNQESFWTMKDVYDSLSNYEIEQLDESIREKYMELYEQAERLLYPEIGNEDLLVDGSLDAEIAETWDNGFERPVGKWLVLNDMSYHAQRTYKIWGTNWHCPDVYGELTMISADIKMLDANMYAGICLNVTENGYYQIRMTDQAKDSEGNQVYQLQLRQYTPLGGQQSLATALPIASGIEIKKDEWFNLCLIAVEGKISIYLNQTLVLTYDDSNNSSFIVGESGARISEGDALVDNIRVYGTKVERPSTDVEITPTYYKDDFEDETVGESPSHWVEDGTHDTVIDNWKVYSINGSKVYGTNNQTDAIATWLHVFDDNSDISMKFMVQDKTAEADFGFLTRYSPTTAFVKVGYDSTQSKWYISSQQSEAQGSTTVYSDSTFAIKAGKLYTAHIVEDGATVSLYIDDKLIVETKKAVHMEHGCVGVYTKGAAIYIDDVDCTFNGGDIPQDGIINYTLEPNQYCTSMEIESLDANTLVGVASSDKKWLSNDAGVTWSNVTNDQAWSELFAGGYYCSLLKLHDGTYIQVMTNEGTSVVQKSEDFTVIASKDLKNWNKIGKIISDEEKTVGPTGLCSPFIHVNTLTEVQLSDGTYRIFCPFTYRSYKTGSNSNGQYQVIYYSDDGGATWQKSETDTRTILPGAEENQLSSWAESKVIKCADGTLRMYYSRNSLGCMQYTVSNDGGVTWEGLYQIPEMQCPKSSFTVYEDPTASGTYYMLWVNNTPAYTGESMPRSRLCLAKTTDGMNWEFLMNCMWMPKITSSQNGYYLYQIIDPSLCVTEDYVYITFGYSEREFSVNYAGSHQKQRLNYIRVEKDKLQARAWDASTVANMNYPKTIEYEVEPQTKYGLGDFFINSNDATLKITTLAGETYTEKLKYNARYYSEPNMYKLGKQTIKVHYVNGYDLSYDIEVVPNYKINWDISDGGEVEPQLKRLMEGATQEFTLIPSSGYRVDYVLINGERASVNKKTFTVENMKEDLDIQVVFTEKSLLDYWPIFLLILLVVIGAGGGFWIYKKRKKKAVNENINMEDLILDNVSDIDLGGEANENE